jgi:hypothetical protein
MAWWFPGGVCRAVPARVSHPGVPRISALPLVADAAQPAPKRVGATPASPAWQTARLSFQLPLSIDLDILASPCSLAFVEVEKERQS